MEREKAKSIEILSPGQNLHFSKEAIRCGADAIYIGAPKHSMRIGNENSLEDIKALIDFAHKYWVKVYIALNCILFSDEDVKEAKEMIDDFYEMKADGIIIQDLGILELDLPPVPIILSTATRCFTKEDIQFYEKCGVSRIVLPRELSFDEIKDITDSTSVPLEVFCYGFTCVATNGNCYLSYYENLMKSGSSEKARYISANHGLCPERCMRTWTLKDADGNIIRENERLLNLKYLNWIEDIEALVSVGIDSFKIAGREKDLKHVKNSTALFSKEADKVVKKLGIKRSSSGRCILAFEPSFHKNFNKGFSDFYLYSRKKEMYSKYDLIGENVGVVSDFDGKSFVLNGNVNLNKGDRLRYQKDNNEVQTLEIDYTENDRYFIKPINDDINGLELYRYFDAVGFKEVEDSVNYRVISVKLNFDEDKVTVTDEDNNTITTDYIRGDIKADKSNLSKLNTECEFIVDDVISDKDIYIDDIDNFLNTVFEKLRTEREKNRPVLTGNIQKNNVPYYKESIDYLENITNSYSKSFFRRHGVKDIEEGLELGTDFKGKKLFTSKYCLRNELDYCSKKCTGKIPPFPWHLEQIESGLKYRVEFDCAKCRMYMYLEDER